MVQYLLETYIGLNYWALKAFFFYLYLITGKNVETFNWVYEQLPVYIGEFIIFLCTIYRTKYIFSCENKSDFQSEISA